MADNTTITIDPELRNILFSMKHKFKLKSIGDVIKGLCETKDNDKFKLYLDSYSDNKKKDIKLKEAELRKELIYVYKCDKDVVNECKLKHLKNLQKALEKDPSLATR